MLREHVETLVVGAGQAGLTMSQMLSRRGCAHLVLERGQIGERWRNERWEGGERRRGEGRRERLLEHRRYVARNGRSERSGGVRWHGGKRDGRLGRWQLRRNADGRHSRRGP